MFQKEEVKPWQRAATFYFTQEGDRGVRGNLDHVSWKMVFSPFIALVYI